MAYKLPVLEKWDLIEVTWHDAASDHQMYKSADIKPKLCFRKTLGNFIKIDSDELIIAGTDDRLTNDMEGDCADLTWIPIGMIKKVARLSRPTIRKKKGPQK